MGYSDFLDNGAPVSTALLLAAGTGSRLAPLTDSTPKCLVEVNKIPILERLIRALRSHGFKRLVVVTGHLSEVIQDYLGSRYADIEITYVVSPVYKTTNNIYSLWLAGSVIDEPFLLIESDLVFQPELLKPMLQPDRIAVSKRLPWMNGTTVTLNARQQLDAFCLTPVSCDEASHFKTVNIYSFSRNTWRSIWKRLDQHICAKRVNGYYESVFAEMVAEGSLTFSPVFFDADHWYEIDTLEDLSTAERMFPGPSLPKVATGESRPALRKSDSVRPQNVVDMKEHSSHRNRGKPMRPSSPLRTHH
jgi:NDP-sugar pyrophosphorylase family protein